MVVYNYNIVGNASDPLTGLVFEIQNATGILTYLLILLVAIISFYVFHKRTQDTGKSGISSIYISTITTILLYYWGIVGDYSTLTSGKMFVSDIMLFLIVSLLIISLSVNKFMRSSPS